MMNRLKTGGWVTLPLLAVAIAALFAACGKKEAAATAAPLKIAYSDWPGWTAMEIGIQKGWFKQAGVDVEFKWFDYLPSMDAYAAGQVDAVMVTNGDALVTGSTGAKGKIIMLTDYSNGNDKIVAKAGIETLADLKGKKIGLELTLVEQLLLTMGLGKIGMTIADVELINVPTNETPQTLASGQVDAIGAWYPSSSEALAASPGSKAVLTSADFPGLIYDTLYVNPESLAQNKEAWKKVVKVCYKIGDFVRDPATKDEAAAIMAAKVNVKAEDYAAAIPGTYFLSLAEAKAHFTKGDGLDSIYGSTATADKFNVENKVYDAPQPIDDYIDPSIILSIE
jgi:NitT/TauT family transport system substrate-binding protein